MLREHGDWASANTSQCGFVSRTTETLHKLATMNATMTPETLLESADHFINFTSRPGIFQGIRKREKTVFCFTLLISVIPLQEF